MNRILIAEDETRIASFLEKGLRANGFTTTVVGDGESAYHYALSGGFDLLVLDIGLPERDGFTVLRQLREARCAMPVVILTARDSVGDTVAGLEGGADDYMSKPFRFEELLARIRLRLRDERAPEVTVLKHGDLSLDLRTRRATRRWPARRADGQRVHAHRDLPQESQAGALPRTTAQPRLGLRLRPGLEHRRRLHPLPAPQARS